MKGRRWFLLAFCGGIVVLSVALLLYRGGEPRRVEIPKADMAARGVKYVGKGKGGSWELEVGELQYSLKRGVASGRDLHLVLTSKDGRVIEAWAKEGEGKPKEGGFVELRGGVKVVVEGWQLETEHLRYDLEKDLVSTSAPIRIFREGMELRGKGLAFDLGRGFLEVGEEVEITLEGKW